jgi:hypothetical protein
MLPRAIRGVCARRSTPVTIAINNRDTRDRGYHMELKDAIGSFLTEFAKFDTHSVGTAIRALSPNPAFATDSEKLLGLDARLTLLERMAFARRVPPRTIQELRPVLMRARKLNERRASVMELLTAHRLDPRMAPTVRDIESCAAEASELQDSLRFVAEKFDHYFSAQQAG